MARCQVHAVFMLHRPSSLALQRERVRSASLSYGSMANTSMSVRLRYGRTSLVAVCLSMRLISNDVSLL
jgi:hypothetical protein